VTIEVEGAMHRVSWSEAGADGALIEESHLVDLLRPSPEAFQMLIDGESWEAGCVASEDGYLVDVVGITTAVGVIDPRRKALRLGAASAGGLVTTQMPGRVVRILVQPGDGVRKGQPLIVIEAMKMENELKSPIDGTVGEIYVAEATTVDTGARLIRVDA
jgi:biotin carboxyl carrier protein